MKMCFVIYCEAADKAVIGALKKAGMKGYTKLEEAQGEGTATEPKLGTHCWPGRNNVLLLALDDEKVGQLGPMVKTLRKEHPRAGLRSFIMPLEEII